MTIALVTIALQNQCNAHFPQDVYRECLFLYKTFHGDSDDRNSANSIKRK